MYEEIDLDAIESNKDEAPDYRPMLRSQSSGSQVSVEYRMRYLSTLESAEKASYSEFAKIAEKEGLRKIAGVFRDILQEEKGHEEDLSDTSSTIVNLRIALQREKDKIQTIQSTIKAAAKENDSQLVAKLQDMVSEEKGHVIKLTAAIEEYEQKKREMEARRAEQKSPKDVCSFGVCVPKY